MPNDNYYCFMCGYTLTMDKKLKFSFYCHHCEVEMLLSIDEYGHENFTAINHQP